MTEIFHGLSAAVLVPERQISVSDLSYTAAKAMFRSAQYRSAPSSRAARFSPSQDTSSKMFQASSQAMLSNNPCLNAVSLLV